MGHPPKATRFLGSETRGISNQRVPSTLSPLMVPNTELQLLWSASSEFEMKEGAVLTEDEVAACLSSLASSTLASSSLEGASKPARRCEQSLWHHTFLSYGSTHPAIPRGLHESPSCRFLVGLVCSHQFSSHRDTDMTSSTEAHRPQVEHPGYSERQPFGPHLPARELLVHGR